MRPFIFLIAAVLLPVFNQAANAQEQKAPSGNTSTSSLASFVEEERLLLAGLHLIPIIIPKGERVGDSFDRETTGLIAGADDCFPKLQIRKAPAQLPSMTTYSEQGLAAALGASGILDIGAEGGAAFRQAYVLSYRDVEVQIASIVQLRNAIPRKAAQECEAVRPYLQALGSSKPQSGVSIVSGVSGLKTPPRRVATLTTESKPQIPVVIGAVYYARRILRVVTSRTMNAEAKASFGQRILSGLGLQSFKLNVEGNKADSHSVEFVGELVIPVAYAPAFEISRTTIAEGGKTTVQLAEINPAEISLNVMVVESVLAKYNLFAGSSRDPFGSLAAERPSERYLLGASPGGLYGGRS